MIRLLAASTLSLLLFFVPGVATAAPRWAPAASATIRPGVALLTPLDARSGNACTANFVYTARGATYLGMAAHCAGTGSSHDAGSGCIEPTLPVGTTVLVRRTDGGTSDATLAYSSWLTMRERGEHDSQRCAYNDFALVALAPADAARVNPTVPELGGPDRRGHRRAAQGRARRRLRAARRPRRGQDGHAASATTRAV